ncbi:TetR/AcrR family transcriptional regulator C-terminal domain-containing protein [Kineococcus glutinatus]|uniref:TetR/AcrR family transcriptional regulator C-terminal domain-containing protein n=1 Tax=Kineococcus glutinatus TaxID=1070872 RepID=A0ABP9HNN6_9ACTN
MPARTREPLTRERVVRAAVEIADRDGLAPLSMRSLARHVGVEAMSLYHHVASKDDLLDGMVDAVFAEIHLPRAGEGWAGQVRLRSTSGREVLLRHRWAVGLMDSRTSPGPATLRAHDAVLGCLRAAGFPVELAAHAVAALDAHLYGYLVQEVSLPFRDGPGAGEVAERIAEGLDPAEFPHLVEIAREHVTRPGYDFRDEFGWGLDLLLEGLARRLAAVR